jgi:Rad3-related DNA helicase
MSLLLDISPADFGLPERFDSFRPTQAEAIDFVTSSNRTFVAESAPTGIGKSLIGVTAAKTIANRAVYLTATKALQEQILSDFGPIGCVDVRGRANYPCRGYTNKFAKNTNCEEGSKKGCTLQHGGTCPYNAAVERAEKSQLITTNYAYWLNARRSSSTALEPTASEFDRAKPIDLLVCDEAHNAGEEICRFLQVTLPYTEWSIQFDYAAGESGLMSERTGSAWAKWAGSRVAECRDELESLRVEYGTLVAARNADPRVSYLEALLPKLKAINAMSDNWVWEIQGELACFDVIWPGRVSHHLWAGVPKVLLLSATLRPYSLNLLGIPKTEYEYREFENGWPKNHGLVYYIPTVRVNYKSTDLDYQKLVARMDEIIAARLDRKGIIHTVSYGRMRKLIAMSKYSKHMYFNENSGESTVIARRFRDAKPPAILISPSFSTGWDFSYKQCEYQIIPKVPFPYAESRVMKERNKDDNYRVYCAILEVTQMIGRGRRAPDDRCETFIIDNNFPMVLAKGKTYVPKDFRVHTVTNVPNKPKKL